MGNFVWNLLVGRRNAQKLDKAPRGAVGISQSNSGETIKTFSKYGLGSPPQGEHALSWSRRNNKSDEMGLAGILRRREQRAARLRF